VAYGDFQYFTGYTMSGSHGEPLSVTYDINSSATTNPFFLVPATPVLEIKDDSPLAWLRSQVEEVAELARAA
jgi:hypothetical protein